MCVSGLPVPAVPAGLPIRTRKKPAKKRNTLSTSHDSESSSDSSDDSDEDWVPGSEEVRRRNKMIKRFIPGIYLSIYLFRANPHRLSHSPLSATIAKSSCLKRPVLSCSWSTNVVGHLLERLPFFFLIPIELFVAIQLQ